jgi:predicted alpha/beta-hydrolase family hydrolase
MKERYETDGVRGVLHLPEQPSGDGIVLTHGAGSNANAPLLVRLADSFAANGLLVLRYDLPFRQQRPKGPPFPAGASHDREGVVRAIAAVRAMVSGRIFAGGHSYGGRQSSMAAASQPKMADALLLLSYPLHPPRRPDQKRTAHFAELHIPALFVHGTADPFGSIEALREAVDLIPAPTDVMPVEGAGHDLKRAGDLASEILTRLRALVQAGVSPTP